MAKSFGYRITLEITMRATELTESDVPAEDAECEVVQTKVPELVSSDERFSQEGKEPIAGKAKRRPRKKSA